MEFVRDDLVVRWMGGGLYLECAGQGLLLDVPAGAAERLGAQGSLGRLRAIAVSGGRIQSVGGLVPLLCALEAHRMPDLPLSIWAPIGEERTALLADAWSRGWPDRYPLSIDAEAPGGQFEVGPFSIRTEIVRRGEPRWRAPASIERVIGVGFQVEAGTSRVAFVPGAARTGAVSHLCRGADLAVIEVGVRPWPSSEEAWRLTAVEAIGAAEEVESVWIVGDDGQFATGGVLA
jgi:hypothetical protein